MSPEQLLRHQDLGQLWSAQDRAGLPADLAAAYQQALAVRQLRLARGEVPRGYKIGFTNRTIWPLYNVFAPIWGTVWDSGLGLCEGEGTIDLRATCQPRLEPEIVFGFRATPVPDATPDQLLDAIEWLAPASRWCSRIALTGSLWPAKPWPTAACMRVWWWGRACRCAVWRLTLPRSMRCWPTRN